MIARYVSELLFTHDCVIIPGFGGWMAQSAGASFNQELKTLAPPSRILLFNNQLIINDGLVVNYISRKEKISYADASLLVIRWTEEIKTSVNAGNRVSLEGLGSFYLNHERKLQFTPDKQSNFLLSSYGLKPVIVSSKTGRKPRQISINSKTEKLNPEKAVDYISIAAAIALLITSVLMFPKFEINLASLAGVWTHLDIFTEENVNDKPGEMATLTVQKELPASATINQNSEPAAENIELTLKDEVVSSKTPVVQPEHNTPEPAVAKGNYYVIAGCFKIEENAGKLVEHLATRGLQAAIIGKSKAGLAMVSAGRFSSASEASEKLSEMKSLLPDGGWVYHQSAEE